jgi:hypothetical protein
MSTSSFPRFGGSPAGQYVQPIETRAAKALGTGRVDHLCMDNAPYLFQADVDGLTHRLYSGGGVNLDVPDGLEAEARRLAARSAGPLTIDASALVALRAQGTTVEELTEALSLLRRRPRVIVDVSRSPHTHTASSCDVWLEGVRLARQGRRIVAVSRQTGFTMNALTTIVTTPVSVPDTVIMGMVGQRVGDVLGGEAYARCPSRIGKAWVSGQGLGVRLSMQLAPTPVGDQEAFSLLAA